MELGTEDFIVPVVQTGRALRCCHIDARGSAPYRHESIYRFYDGTGRLLYVGITWNIKARWVKHHRKPWWSQVRRAKVTCFHGEGIARRHEIRAIQAEAPIYNVARPKVGA
jgi:predicted GIY-YIG superfamily endonuclease